MGRSIWYPLGPNADTPLLPGKMPGQAGFRKKLLDQALADVNLAILKGYDVSVANNRGTLSPGI